MRFSASLVASTAFALSFSSLSAAHQSDTHKRHAAYWARQAQVNAAPAPAATPAAAAPAPPAGAPHAPVPIAATVVLPLASITMSSYIEATAAIAKPFTPGATAPIPNAPPIPTAALVAANYPPLDTIPDVNSPQVKAWLSKIDMTKIPSFAPTKDGSCESDPAAAADKNRCWWTCGGCTRPTDISTCPTKNDWGVSYDDGPSPYTPKLLNFLDSKALKATFFVVGSRVLSRPEMLRAEHIAGHEISVHTWSHHALTTLTNEQIVAELGWTMQSIKDVIGVTPTTMRPPFGDIDDRVRAVAMAMGLTPILWTSVGEDEFDTNDWRIPGGTATGQSSFDQFNKILGLAANIPTGFIVLEHDLYQETVDMAIDYFLPAAFAHNPKFNLKSINQCLGKPLAASYLETSGGAAPPASGNSSAPAPAASGSGAAPAASGSGSVVGPKPSAGSTTSGSSTANGTASSPNGAVGVTAPRYLSGVAAFIGFVSFGALLI